MKYECNSNKSIILLTGLSKVTIVKYIIDSKYISKLLNMLFSIIIQFFIIEIVIYFIYICFFMEHLTKLTLIPK